MLNKVDVKLTKGRNFDSIDIAHKLPPKPVDEMPYVETVGLDSMLDKVWNSIQDENVSIIGLYGMAGAGKTTLLKRIHSEFGKSTHDFDLVLWVVVSRDFNINNIMNDIRNRIGIDDNIWNKSSSQDQRVAKIYQVLKQKKFVLMLDDLWGKLELEKVGVPISKDKSKVLFTTRSEDVCAKMQAQKKFKVECLKEQEAFDLFCLKVGEETLKCHGEIPRLAWDMAKECAGLPLALVTVGSAMAGVKSIEAWRQAKGDLRGSPWTASNFEEQVFHILKFSYDRLPDVTHKNCFLYCALYPEDYKIIVDNLIDRWVGEGFLSKKSIYDMYEQGKSIIEKLKLSCLLEGVEDSDGEWRSAIKMHDVIREMALWLARDQDRSKEKIVIQGEALSMSEMDSERLNVVERISMISCRGFWQVPACPNLITLCVLAKVVIIDYSNIQSMTRLKVLDLSNTSIKCLPKEIGQLFNLEYLNLSRTEIEEWLPIELKHLRVLIMEYCRFNLGLIPLEVIESLEQLKVFRFCADIKRIIFDYFEGEETFLEKLESLPKLEELFIKLTTISGIHKLLQSAKLRACSRQVWFNDIFNPLEMSSLLESLSRMKHMEHLNLSRLPRIKEGSSITNTCHLNKLRSVNISVCGSITHLTWLRYASLLEFLEVSHCISIEEVVKEAEYEDGGSDKDNTNGIFPNLKQLRLQHLPNLESIYNGALALPLLKYIYVQSCPNLRKLPINSSSACKDSLIAIRGEGRWLNNLEWEETDTTIKDLVHSKFRYIYTYTSVQNHGTMVFHATLIDI
ncbi:P-loop containing nucleoside triphosphate hydrolase [Sesbania bispinosa]|nr:P-loop containing nucleoside triphosphate hydrolase [Sesbania bispinosa]